MITLNKKTYTEWQVSNYATILSKMNGVIIQLIKEQVFVLT